jgi:ketosteroid isomerase-like protein
MQKAFSFLLVSYALLTSSCDRTADVDDRAAGTAAIRAADEQWSAAAAKNDLPGTLAFYADDAVLLAPNVPIARDPKSIRETWAAMLGPGTAISWKVTKTEAARSGELGYLYGTYSLSMKDPKGGPSVTDSGKMVEIWKKQANGNWKCIVDTFNSDLPATPAPEPKK